MRTALNDLSVLDYQNQIRLPYGGKPVGDDKGSPSFHQMFDRILNLFLCHCINGGSRLVEYKDSGVCKDSPRKR